MSRFNFDEDIFYRQLDNLLKQEMPKYGSWKELADALDVNEDTVLKWRKRKRFPNLRDFIKLCEIANIPPGQLIFPKK
jgi:transcriptional regulator with XRE-family HTH domain